MKHIFIFAAILLIHFSVIYMSSLQFYKNYNGSSLEYENKYPELLAMGEQVTFFDRNNSELSLHTMFRHDIETMRNAFNLNNQNSEMTFDNSTIDVGRMFFLRRILDVSLDYKYKNSLTKDRFYFFCTMRNKTLAGNYESALSLDDSVLVSSGLPLYGDHYHDYLQNVIWARELWAAIKLEELIQIPFGNEHCLRMGLFPFSLGRGISLGNAYSIGFFGKAGLGFDPQASIDQFAPGCILSGYLVDKKLSYDLYLGFLRALDNPPSSIAINQAVMNQSQYHYVDPKFFYVRDKALAFRLIYKAKKDLVHHAAFEPYLLVDMPRWQIQDYIAKSSGRLITLGCSGECYLNNFDFGFDFAFNFVKAKYLPQDDNSVEIYNLNGYEVAVNTDVVDDYNGVGFPALASCANQKAIKSVSLSPLNNNKSIPNTHLINSSGRFKDEVGAIGRGSMCVFDMAYSFFDSKFRIKFAIGYASGGDNPAFDLRANKGYKLPEKISRSSDAFIPIQDLYNGKRVKSGFLMAGAGSEIVRFRSFTNPNLPYPYPVQEYGFSDLVHIGLGLDFKSADMESVPKYMLNPNLLWFWQDKSIQLPAFYLPGNGKIYADKYLGLEANVILRWNFTKGLEFFALGAWFWPGQYYHDIKGLATNPAQTVYFDNLSKGITDQLIVPTNGTNLGWVFNAGLIYNF